MAGTLEVEPGFIRRPEILADIKIRDRDELDAALVELDANKQAWVEMPIGERIAILDQILDDMHKVAEDWVSLCVNAKSTHDNAYGVAEEWAYVAAVLRLVRLLKRSLHQIQKSGLPVIPGAVESHRNGQIVAQVFPSSLSDRLLLPGTMAEVWMQPGVTLENLPANQASFYQKRPEHGSVCLVLGAGNVSMLVPSDFLYKLFVEGKVVLLKLNPVNAYLESVLEKAFQSLIRRGLLKIVQGGVEEGTYLCHHPLVGEIHTTGSDKTYEDVMFGPGEEGAQRKARRQPLLEKRFTGELGNVTPIIVVPGQWSQDDIRAQAERISRWMVINAGFNCLTPRVVIQWAGWSQREALNQAIRDVLQTIKTRKAYYPGAVQRFQDYIAAHPEARPVGSVSQPGYLPWAYIPGLDPASQDDICFKNESFCGVLSETAIEAESEEAFVEKAVQFANHTLWGNLTATLVVHPESLKEKLYADCVESAIEHLHYGMVLINQFAGIGFMALTTTWGAFPGNHIDDIQSGVGVTSNVLMFDRPQKSVVRSPFRLSPDPFAIHARTLIDFAKQLAAFQYRPSLSGALKLSWLVLRS